MVSTPHHLFTLNSPQFILKRYYYIWRGFHCLTLLILESYTLHHVAHFSTILSINLSLTIILKRHTITPFHTEHFTIHVIEKNQPHICAATSFHAEFFTTLSEEQVLLEWILKPPPFAIFFHTQLFITHIGLKKNHTRFQTLGLECTAQPPKYQTNPNPNQPSTEKIIDGDIWNLAVKVQR